MGRGMIDLTGQRFGRLRVVDFAGMGGPNRMWLCVCDCGAKTTVPARNLISGNTKSCGCLRLDRLERRARKLTHNGRRQSLAAWAKETKIPKQTIYNRLRRGWPIDLVLSRSSFPRRPSVRKRRRNEADK